MIAEITHLGRQFRVDLSDPIDLSLAVVEGQGRVSAWNVGPVTMEPVQHEGLKYTVKDGAPVNFRSIQFNPHGHGTHTECVGHIAENIYPVGDLLERYFFIAQLISVLPEERRAQDERMDSIITLELLRNAVDEHPPEALVIRTLPYRDDGSLRDWSNTNPCYLQSTACAWLRSIGVKHLLLDLPSVDREEDGGVLAAHHAFWDHPGTVDLQRTITELIHVPSTVRDGPYLLELQVANVMNDAAPSRPVLYAMLP